MANLHSPRTAWLVGLTIAAVGGGAAAVWHVTSDATAQHEVKEKADDPGRSPRGTVAVRIYEVKHGREAKARQLTGSVRPRYQTDVAFRVSGKILRRHIEVGEQVKAGQLAVRIGSAGTINCS